MIGILEASLSRQMLNSNNKNKKQDGKAFSTKEGNNDDICDL